MLRRVIAAIVIVTLLFASAQVAAQTPPGWTVYLPLVTRDTRTMRIARFGDTYESAYVFSLTLMEDSWQSARPPITQGVSGANGTFDHYGANDFPLAPVTAVKKFSITGTSSADLEDSLIVLRAAMVAAGRTKLWWLDRDGTTKYWSWAKFTGLKAADSTKERGRWLKSAELTFLMSEGVWYGDTMQSWSNTIVVPASTIGMAVNGLSNDGNVRALLDVRIVPDDGLTIEDSAVGVFGVAQWESASDVADGIQLFVLASQYKTVTTDHIDEKDSIAIAAGTSEDVWGDGRFVYSANDSDGIHSYSVDGTGQLANVNSDDQGDNARGVWGDGQYVFLANGDGGLLVYSVDAAGAFSLEDSDDQGGLARGVWGDGQFVFLANDTLGLLVYSVSDAGILALENSDDQGDAAYNVWGDGKFIYLANHSGGLLSYSVADDGTLTFIDSHAPGTGPALSVWGDGKFIYVAFSGGGLYSYSVDADGNLNNIDSDDQGGSAFGVWGDGTRIYLANEASGVSVYAVNAIGELTFLDAFDPGGTAQNTWGDGMFVYLSNDTTLRSYTMNAETNAYTNLDIGEGSLLNLPDIDQITWLWLPPGKTLTRVVVDCDDGGAAEEVDVYLTWWDTYVF